VQVWHDQPRLIGWATLAVLLLLTGLAYALCAPPAAPAGRHRRRRAALWRGRLCAADPRAPCPARPDELGDLAATINTMGADIHQMLDAKRACCWPSATSCAAR
jgi:HAMP domain-containing protein